MRGTTPQVIFKIPLEATMISRARITFKKDQAILLAKDTEDCTVENGAVSTMLTRAETVLFPDNAYIKVQLEIQTPAGQSLKTRVHTVYSSELLNPEALK